MKNGQSHTKMQLHKPDIVLPSERKFGTVFFGLFALLAGLASYRAQSLNSATYIFAALAVLILGFAWLYPKALRPLNVAWMTLGQWLGKIVSPIVLGTIFLLIFTPLALVLRLFGRDELSLKRASSSTTYWITRGPQNADTHGFNNQF